jgi:hypothetical protein
MGGPLEQHFLLTSILQVLGKQREEAVRALYTRLCIQAGMEPGRMAAAMASWSSVLRILSPLFYSRLYTSVSPAAPYAAAAALQVLACVVFMGVARRDREFEAPTAGVAKLE